MSTPFVIPNEVRNPCRPGRGLCPLYRDDKDSSLRSE
jgi:hypothetical protein